VELGHDERDDESEGRFERSASLVPRFPTGLVGEYAGLEIAGSNSILSTRIMAPGWESWARRKRRVERAVTLFALLVSANDRVPRFSRRVLADSVRFVRFDMT